MLAFKLSFILIIVSGLANARTSSVLFVGDSHVAGTFGQALDLKLRENFQEVTTLGSCGSIARWWYKGNPTPCGYFFHRLQKNATSGLKHSTPLIEDELKSLQPQVVVIEFGANYIPYQNPNYTKQDLQKLIDSVKNAGAKCFFVGLPETRKHKVESHQMRDFLKTFVPKQCEFFDSIPLTPYPATGGDGAHYETQSGRLIAKKWANAVSEWVQTTLLAN